MIAKKALFDKKLLRGNKNINIQVFMAILTNHLISHFWHFFGYLNHSFHSILLPFFWLFQSIISFYTIAIFLAISANHIILHYRQFNKKLKIKFFWYNTFHNESQTLNNIKLSNKENFPILKLLLAFYLNLFLCCF